MPAAAEGKCVPANLMYATPTLKRTLRSCSGAVRYSIMTAPILRVSLACCNASVSEGTGGSKGSDVKGPTTGEVEPTLISFSS